MAVSMPLARWIEDITIKEKHKAVSQKTLYRNTPQRGHRTLHGKVLVTWARAVPVLGLLRDIFKGGWPGQGDGRGDGQLRTPPDPPDR